MLSRTIINDKKKHAENVNNTWSTENSGTTDHQETCKASP